MWYILHISLTYTHTTHTHKHSHSHSHTHTLKHTLTHKHSHTLSHSHTQIKNETSSFKERKRKTQKHTVKEIVRESLTKRQTNKQTNINKHTLSLFSIPLLALNARHDLVQLFIFWQFNALHLFLIVQDLCDHIFAGLKLWLDRMNDNSQWKNNAEKYSGRQIPSKIIQSQI